MNNLQREEQYAKFTHYLGMIMLGSFAFVASVACVSGAIAIIYLMVTELF